MDTSEQYIKMCKKAREIQTEHSWEYGDWLVDIMGSIVIYISWEQMIDYCPEYYKDCIWLPRQDQLQERVARPDKITLAYEFAQFCYNDVQLGDWPIMIKSITMEQLWLAFVMKEKYKKVWNGENWIKV